LDCQTPERNKNKSGSILDSGESTRFQILEEHEYDLSWNQVGEENTGQKMIIAELPWIKVKRRESMLSSDFGHLVSPGKPLVNIIKDRCSSCS
jgi:hypothetical protein